MQKTIITLLCAAGMMISTTAATAENLRIRKNAPARYTVGHFRQVPVPPLEMADIMGHEPQANQKPQSDLSGSNFGAHLCERQTPFERGAR